MKEVTRFPSPAGDLGWFNIAANKNYAFADPKDIAPDYDFVVVGAGFGGVFAASRLAENRPDAAIALFDALPVGMGDSGRNAGFMIDVPHITVGDPKTSMDDHKWRYRLNTVVIDRMRRIKNDNNLQVDWQECGKYLAAREKSCLGSLDFLATFLEGIGGESRMVERDELAKKLGTNYYIRALYTPGAILMNPSETVRGLATALPKNVHVFENTPVLEVVEGTRPVIRLANGKTIRTGSVILTVNTFIKHFGVRQGERMFGIHSFGAFTRELTNEEMRFFQNVEPWGCTAAHPAGTTVRYTTTRRVFVRNDLTFATHLNIAPERIYRARKSLRKAFENRFPFLRHVNFEYVYGGMIPLSLNTQSLFGKVGQNVYAGAVGDGLGVTRSSMLGLYLADMICGMDSEELRYMVKTNVPNWCPPEPFRTVGATARLMWEELRAGGEI